jgi:hypothetical protein
MQILKSILSTTKTIISIKKRKLALPVYQTLTRQNQNQNSSQQSKKKSFGVRSAVSDFGGLLGKIAATLSTLGIMQWVSDSKNKDSVVNILKFAKGIFDFATTVAEFGVDNLLTGLSEITHGNLLERMFGALKAITGFLALKWLISPLKMFGDIKSIVKFIKAIPDNILKLSKFIKGLDGAFGILGKWSAGLGKFIFKGISSVFSKAITKVFGASMWSLFKSAVGKSVGGLVGGATKAIGGMISKGAVRSAGKILSKIPIVGSLIGFGINLALGDPLPKATFKLGASAVGGALGGLVGVLFPPAAPATAVIGALLGDYVGDKLFDYFIPPLALGGIVSHKSSEGTHVIVAEKEDEVVIPLSMLTMDNFAGSAFYDNIKTVGSSILGAVQSVLGSMGIVGNSIQSSISQFISPLIKMFGVTKYNSTDTNTVSNQENNNSKQQIGINTSNLTDDDIVAKILGTTQISKVSASGNVENISDLSIRGLLRGILDVVTNGNLGTSNGGVLEKMLHTTQEIGTQFQSTVQSAFNNIRDTFDGQGSSTVVHSSTYTPGGGGLNGKEIDSRGKRLTRHDYAIAIPGQNKIKDQIPYNSVVTLTYNGKSIDATVRDGGPYIPGRQLDMTTATAKALEFDGVGNVAVTLKSLPAGFDPNKKYYFGEATYKPFIPRDGRISTQEANKAVNSVVTGNKFLILNNKKQFSSGGEYAYKSTKPHAYGSPRRNRTHAGHDIPISKDGTFQSILGGTVVYKGYEPGKNKYGNYVDIYNDQRKVTERIAEVADLRVKVGDTISPGQIVGSGTSTGVIHYEIRPMDVYTRQYGYKGTIDPIKYLSDNNKITLTNGMINLNPQMNTQVAETIRPRLEGRNPFTKVNTYHSSNVSDVSNIVMVNRNDVSNFSQNVHDYSSIRRSQIPNNNLIARL